MNCPSAASNRKYPSHIKYISLFYGFFTFFLLQLSIAPAQAANDNMSLSVSNGTANSLGGIWKGISLNGGQGNPTLINVHSNLTLTGNGNASPLVSGASTGVEFRVFGSTFRLGNATSASGGYIAGNIVLDQKSILEARNAVGVSATKSWLLRAIGNTDGAIAGTGELRVRSNGILQTGPIGADIESLRAITIQDSSRLNATENIWTKNLALKDTSSMVARRGNINADLLSLTNASSISASSGDVTVGSIQSASASTVSDMNSIETETGNITVNGQINLQSGLLSMRSGGDININYDGAAITGAGELYLRSKGNIYGAESLHEKTSISALKISSSSNISVKDVLAAQLTAENARISQDLTIKGNSADLFGQKVDYGLLELSGSESEVGGNLDVTDAKMKLGTFKVAEDAYFNRVDGTFNKLSVTGQTILDGGSLDGGNLESGSMKIGGRQFPGTLKTSMLQPGNLEAGRNASIQTGTYVSTGGNLVLKDGASLIVEKDDIGSATMPLGDIELSNMATFHAPASIFAKTLSAAGDSQTLFSATNNITLNGSVAGSEKLSLLAGGKIKADNIIAGSLIASELDSTGNVTIYNTGNNNASLKLSGPTSQINGEFYLSHGQMGIENLQVGKNAIFNKASGTFQNLDVSSTLYLAGSSLLGANVTANDIWLAGDATNSISTQKTAAKNLFIYDQSSLSTEEFTSSGGTVAVAKGGKLNITKGDLATNSSRAGNIYVSEGSELNVAGSVYAKNMLSFGGQNIATIGGDLNLEEDIYGPGWLEAKINGTTSGINASLSAISTKNLILKGSFYFNGLKQSNVDQNFILQGPDEGAKSTSSFYKLQIGNLFSAANADIYGYSLKAGLLHLGSENSPTMMSLTQLEDESGLSLGKNAYLSIGQGSRAWLADILRRRNDPANQALALKKPFVAGNRGLTLDASQTFPLAIRKNLIFGRQSFLAVDGIATRTDYNPAGIISAASPMQAIVHDGAKLLVDGVVANKVYSVLGRNITTHYENQAAWGENQVETDSHLIGLRKITDQPGSFISFTKPASDIYPGLDGEIGGGIDNGFGSPTTPVTPPANSPSRPENPDLPLPQPPIAETPMLPAIPAQPDVAFPAKPEQTAPDLVPSPSTPENSGYPPQDESGSGALQPTTPNRPGASGSVTRPPTSQAPSSNPGSVPSQPEPDTPAGTNPVSPGYPVAGNPSAPAQDSGLAKPDQPGDFGTQPELGTEERHFFSPWPGVRFLSRITSVKYMDHDYHGVVKTLESASRIAVLGAVPQFARSVNVAMAENALGRANFARQGMAHEESYGNGWTAWMTPLFNAVNGYGLRANNFNYNYSANMGGVMMGIDRSFGNQLRIGVDASIGGGYSQSGGDLVKTSNHMSFWGAGIYAGWNEGNFQLALGAHYTATANSLTQKLPYSLQMKDLEGNLTAHALSEELELAWIFPFDNWRMRPHAGVRHTSVHTDNYSIYSDGAIIDGAAIDQSIWTFPFGLEFSGTFKFSNDWTLSPVLDFYAQPAAGFLDARTSIHYTGLSRGITLHTRTGDAFQAGGKLGLEACQDNFTLGLNWQLLVGPHSTENIISGILKVEF